MECVTVVGDDVGGGSRRAHEGREASIEVGCGVGEGWRGLVAGAHFSPTE